MLTPEQVAALRAPFALNEIEWRPSQGGLGLKKDGTPWLKLLAYITARSAMDRLDSVVGVGNWSSEIRPIELRKRIPIKGSNSHEESVEIIRKRTPIEGTKDFVEEVTEIKKLTPIKEFEEVVTSGIICRLRVLDSWYEDVSDLTDIEDLKGGASGAFKRASVHPGVGRYLYDLEDVYAEVYDRGEKFHPGGRTKSGNVPPFRWSPPGEEWFRRNAPWMLPKEGPAINPYVIATADPDQAVVATPKIVWPDGMNEASRAKLEGADLPKLKAYYAATSLKKGIKDAPWNPEWSREDAISAYLKLLEKQP